MRTTRPARRESSPALVRALRVLTLAALPIALTLGCGADPVPPAAATCPSGSVAWTDGSCMPVGIQGCAEIFLEADGLCHPRMEKCPAGTIPSFNEGCVPVGIQGCAEMFMEDDGLCHPSMAKCPAGTIPRFDEGCVPVGIQDCAEVFIEDDGLCHPTMAKCPAGTFAVPQLGCVPIDGPNGCGSGTWGNMLDVAAEATIWVDPSAAASGNGSQASPVKTIAEAMALVPALGRVALAAGTYDEPIHIDKTVTIEGRCPSMVRVHGTGTANTDAYVVWVAHADGVTLRGLEIGGAGIGILATDSTWLTIEAVRVRSSTSAGLSLQGPRTEVWVANSWIDATLPGDDGLAARGVDVANGARVTLTESAVVDNHHSGVSAAGLWTEVDVVDSLVEGTLPQQSDGSPSGGASATGGATLTIVVSAMVGNHEYGVLGTEYATNIVMIDSLVEGTTLAEPDAAYGAGVSVQGGATLVADGAAILGNRFAGVYAGYTAATVTITRSLVEGTLPRQSDGVAGAGVVVLDARVGLHESAISDNEFIGLTADGSNTEITVTGTLIEDQGVEGVEVTSGASVTVDGSAIAGNQVNGVALFHDGTNVAVTGSLIAGTVPSPGEPIADGVAVGLGARFTLETSAIIDSGRIGLMMHDTGTSVTARGNLIARSLGRGVNIQEGAALVLDRNAIVENHEIGIGAFVQGTELTARHNLVESTLPDVDSGDAGLGVAVEDGAQMTIEVMAIAANHEVGLAVHGAGSSVIATSTLVEGTLPRESDGRFGEGILCIAEATMQLAWSILRNNHGVAFGVDAGTAEVSRSLIDTVLPGSITLNDAAMTAVSAGDGLQATLGSTFNVTDTRIHGCARAGVLFEDSSGTLSGVVSTENQFGLVLQGERRPVYEGGTNQFTGNTGRDIVIGGDLPIPDSPSPVPPAPTAPSP